MNKNKINITIEYIVFIFLLINPILDVCSCYDLSFINVFVRGLFFAFTIIFLFFHKDTRKQILLLTGALFSYLIIYNTYFNISLLDSINNTIKLFYLPVTLLFFYKYKSKLITDKVPAYILFVYLSLFVLSYIFGFGFNIYNGIESLKTGFRGVFNSINEISAIIICLLPIATKYILKEKNYILLVVIYLLSIITSLLMGTKVMLFGMIIIILYFILPKIYNYLKPKSIKIKLSVILGSILLVLLCFYIFTFTITFKNMLVQTKYFNISNIFSYEFINKIIFSERLTFISQNYIGFLDSSLINNLFGVGFNTYYKLVEIDVFDIFFRYGIIGFIIYFISFIIPLIKVKLRKEYLLSYILLILISLTSGHVLIYPAVCIYFGLNLFLNKSNK